MHALSAEQWSEIRRVVCDKHVAVIDSPAHNRPVLARAQPEPSDVRRLAMPALVREPDQLRTQTFVDQEFHVRTTSNVSDAFGDRDRHPTFMRGRPRRGWATA